MACVEMNVIYQELAAKLRITNSKVLPKIFQRLANLEQARILLEMPSSSEDVAKKLGLSQEGVDRDIQELFEKGVLLPGKRGWTLPPSWGWLHDAIGASNIRYEDDELYDLGAAMRRESLEVTGRRLEQEQATGQPRLRQVMRIIPKWRSIQGIPGVLPCEDALQILQKMSPIVVVRCPCKRMDRRRGCRDSVPLESCIHGGRLAQYSLGRQAGRKISLDECLALMDEMDKHLVVNMVDPASNVPENICNCHTCCCGVFKIADFTGPKFGLLPYAKSRFVAEVAPDRCTGCRICVDQRCPVGALHMNYYPEFGEKRAFVDQEDCIGCGLCALTCPSEAHQMRLVRPPEHIPKASEIVGIPLAGA
jgi:Na+-translocating ferredoxin:NAD+ oxidoreductase subunit B